MLDDGGEADTGEPEQASGELGVEELVRAQADLRQAREVLGGGVQDPLGAADGLGDGERSGTAMGSMSQVPEPSRRSWTR